MRPLDDKTFVLGIGAQKAGTSWLFRYLESRPDFYMSPIKELHWFDTKYRDDLRPHFNARFIERLTDRVKRGGFRRRRAPLGEALLDRVDMISGNCGYRDYFEKRVPGDCDFFGEVSPSYAILPPKAYREVRSMFPKLKVILLLRDPVDRLYSQLRMAQRKDFFEDASAMFVEALDMPRIIERSLYHETITKLDKVFAEDEVYVGFYETLFNDDAISEICDFLGCEFMPGDYQRKVNADRSAEVSELPPAAVEAGVNAFADVYQFCRERFGDKVPAKWKN